MRLYPTNPFHTAIRPAFCSAAFGPLKYSSTTAPIGLTEDRISRVVAFSTGATLFSRTFASVKTMLTLIVAGVGVAAGVWVRVCEGAAVAVDVRVGVTVRDGVLVRVIVCVGVFATVDEAVTVRVIVAAREGVLAGVKVDVTVTVRDAVGVRVGVSAEVAVAATAREAVGAVVCVPAAANKARVVEVIVTVRVGVRVGVRVREGEATALGVLDGGRVADAMVCVGVKVIVAEGVIEGVNVTVGGSPLNRKDPDPFHSLPMKMRTSYMPGSHFSVGCCQREYSRPVGA
jgi:hypothetical protein